MSPAANIPILLRWAETLHPSQKKNPREIPVLHQVRNIRTTSHAAPSSSASCFHSGHWSPFYSQDPSPSLSHQKPPLLTLNDISINSSFSPPPFLKPRYLTINCNSDTSNFSRREGFRICQRVPLSTGPVSSGSVCFAETCFMHVPQTTLKPCSWG